MQTFDNTRPLVAGDGRRRGPRLPGGDARACSTRPAWSVDYAAPAPASTPRRRDFLAMEADYEAARLLTLQAAWMADNGKPNSLQASMAKAKAGRVVRRGRAWTASSCAAASATARTSLLEKWARDAKILDIFEGTQQIQLLIVARQLLGKTSAELG